jgi:hypothetical protein
LEIFGQMIADREKAEAALAQAVRRQQGAVARVSLTYRLAEQLLGRPLDPLGEEDSALLTRAIREAIELAINPPSPPKKTASLESRIALSAGLNTAQQSRNWGMLGSRSSPRDLRRDGDPFPPR